MAKKVTKKITSRKEIRRRRSPGWIIAIGLVVVLGGAATIFFLRNGTRKTAIAAPTITPTLASEISVSDAFLMYGGRSIMFLDVRSADFWNEFHINQSVNFPADGLAGRLNDLPKGERILIFDANGGEAAQKSYDLLKQNGFSNVYWVNGGMQAWVEKGYPYVGTAPY